MAFCAWVSLLNSQRSSSPLSAIFLPIEYSPGSLAVHRERREHRVFNKLLQLIPGLEECLMEKSEQEATLPAELVMSHVPLLMHHDTIGILMNDSIQI